MSDNGLGEMTVEEQDPADQTAYTDADQTAPSTLDEGENGGGNLNGEKQADVDGRKNGQVGEDVVSGIAETVTTALTDEQARPASEVPSRGDVNVSSTSDVGGIAGEEGDYTQASSAVDDVSGTKQDQTYDGDASIQFANGVENGGQDNDNASTSFPRSSSSRSLSHHTKRRKINTCLPCKRRKVKCDREKPYCGQCKKSSIPAEECTWSAAVESHGASLPLSAAQTLFPSTTFTTVGDITTANTSSGTQWYDPANSSWNQFSIPTNGATAESNGTQVLLERIAALEALIESSRDNGRREGAASETGSSGANIFTQTLESDAGIAADALAMIARQASNSLPLAIKPSRLRCPRMFPDLDAVLLPTCAADIRNAVSLLPHLPVLMALLDVLDNVQNHGIYIGVPVKLCSIQIDVLASSSSNSQAIDLSMVAAALLVCAVGLDLLSSEQAAELSITDSEYAISVMVEEWSTACDRLLYAIDSDRRPNINTLVSKALRRHLQASNGLAIPASATLQSAIQLARGMGLDKMQSQREDMAKWTTAQLSASDVQEAPTDVIHAISLLSPIYPSAKDALPIKAPWLSQQCALVSEAARSVYTHLVLQDWLSDPFSSVAVPVSSRSSLPLPLEPIDALDTYPLQSENDTSIASPAQVLCYQYSLTQKLALWKHEGKISAAVRSAEKAVNAEQRPAVLQQDASDVEGGNTIAVQNMRAWTELVRSYCLFVLQRAEASLADQCIDSAVLVLQNRAALGAGFPAPLHKFFDVQRFTLEAALMIVIYLHQYGAQNSEERRQALQSLIDDAYAQPGFENSHSLLSLSFDIQDDIEAQTVNGNKRSAPDDDVLLPSNQNSDGGLKLSNGRRLSSSHPIVVGLRTFVHGQSLPFGNAQETVDFWDAIGRQSQLFLVA